MNLYTPYDKTSKAGKLIRKARKTNALRDLSDMATGFGTPHTSIELALRTAMSALVCGIETDDWNCVAEAFEMIQELESKVRT